ncbi:MAG: recombinase family protein [Treponema sp.]|nr:recombinase family protein [Treponema sp.]
MVFGYARCSTNENKQDIERQVQDLKNMGAKKIFQEYESGSNTKRPQLKKLQEQIKKGDTLIVLELSRITRSVHHLCHILEWASDQNITIKAGGFTADCNNGIDPMVESMFLMMGIFAQMERKMTIRRVKSGVANARAKGIKLGRPALTKSKLPQAFLNHYPTYQKGSLTKAEFARLCNCSRPSLYRYLEIIENDQTKNK